MLQRLQQREVACGSARWRGLRQGLPIADADRTLDPDLVGPTLIV